MYHVGVDIGGTFTDCVLVDRQGTTAVRSARVGLVATAGHGDALAMMRGAGREPGA